MKGMHELVEGNGALNKFIYMHNKSVLNNMVDCAVEQYVFELKLPSKRARLQWCICLDNCAMNF